MKKLFAKLIKLKQVTDKLYSQAQRLIHRHLFYIYDLKISRKLWDEMLGRYRNYHKNRIIGSMSKKYHDFVDNMQIIQRLRQLGRSVKLTPNR